MRWNTVLGMALAGGLSLTPCVGAAEAVARRFVFDRAWSQWETPTPADGWVLESGADPAPAELCLRRIPDYKSASVRSRAFPVEPNHAYRLTGWIKTLRGGTHNSFNLLWKDKDGRFLGQDYAYVLPLVISDWTRHEVVLIAPPCTAQAQVNWGAARGVECALTGVDVTPLDHALPVLAMDVTHDVRRRDNPDPTPFTLRMENRGAGVLNNLKVRVEVPAGLRLEATTDRCSGALGHGESLEWTGMLRGYPVDMNAPIHVEVAADTLHGERVWRTSSLPFVSVARERETPTAQLEPRPPDRSRIMLGAYYFPVMLDWDRNGYGVRKVPAFKPRLGYYDETRPEVADWHIAWATSHGISYFVFDWYFNKGMDFLNDALEQGFLRGRLHPHMRFCIDWCNEGHCGEFKPVDFGDAALDAFMHAVVERYFKYENYLRIGGRPVVFIHVPVALANDRGGWEGCREGLDRMRAIARRAGHPGVYFVAVQSNYPWVLDYRRGGFNAVAPYACGFSGLTPDPVARSVSYAALMPRHAEYFRIAREDAHRQGLAYIPSAWVGWDDAPRSRDRSVRTAGNTPALFRRMIEMLPDYVEEDTRLALVEAWNEWGEGGACEPDVTYDFGRLGAVRDVLCENRGPYEIPTPPLVEVAGFETHVAYEDVIDDYQKRYAASFDWRNAFALHFESADDCYFKPFSGIAMTQIKGGCQAGRATSGDPVLVSPPYLNMCAEGVAGVRLRMRAKGAGHIRLFWRHDARSPWIEKRHVSRPLIPDDEFHEYLFKLSGNPEWKGNIHQFRLDPMESPGTFAIDDFSTVPAGEIP